MDALYFWVMIGILGFLLYISPGIFVHRMYESFAAPSAPAAAASPAKAVALTPSTPPKAASPTQNQINNLMQVLNTPIPVESPTAPPPEIVADGATQIPVEYDTTRSRPQSTREPVQASAALKHGDLYASTLPQVPLPGSQGMLGSMGTQPRAPAERVVYIERERQRDCDSDRCDRPAANPNCPDMRDYIRKDSIPCWGCKLR